MTKKALIVDDSRLACRVMAKMLNGFKIASAEVYSAEEALEYLRTKQPDVIFLDHMMPGMNGLEMMKIVKNNPVTATIPVMMYTSKEGEVYLSQARSLGAIDVLPKGLEEKHLLGALEKYGLIEKAEKNKIPQNTPDHKIVAPLSVRHSPALAKPNKEPASSDTARTEKLPASEKYNERKQFWHQTVEPYLQRQHDRQQKELQYKTNLQTKRLTRELHQTLEQFEHALVLRLESHAEFVASIEEDSKGARTKWFVIIVILILALQVGIVWQLWNANQFTHNLMVEQSKNEIQQENRNKLLNGLAAEVKQLKNSASSKQSSLVQVSVLGTLLLDEQNEVIAELFIYDENNGLYSGTTSNGYRFVVNEQGQLSNVFFNKYFLTEECNGDIFVSLSPGVILRDENESIWYVDRLADEVLMNVNSVLTEKNECIILSNEELSLNRLEQNVYFETGIDENQKMRMVIK